MSENNDLQQRADQDPTVEPSTPAARTAESPAPATSPAPVAPSSSDQPLPPPAPTTQPVAPAAQQPPQPQQPSAQPPVPGQPSQPQQPNDAQQPARPEQPQQPQQSQQPTFRENGAFSFFATPSDPDDDPAPLSWGFKIGWFVLGLVGGMLGLVMTWLSTATLSPKRRRQALIATWAGFACQAIIFFIVVLTGTSLPFAPTGTGSTAAQSAGSAGSGSSAFG